MSLNRNTLCTKHVPHLLPILDSLGGACLLQWESLQLTYASLAVDAFSISTSLGSPKRPAVTKLGVGVTYISHTGIVSTALPFGGFDPWTVQPVASRYTYYATRPTENKVHYRNTYLLTYLWLLSCLPVHFVCHLYYKWLRESFVGIIEAKNRIQVQRMGFSIHCKL